MAEMTHEDLLLNLAYDAEVARRREKNTPKAPAAPARGPRSFGGKKR